LGRYFNQASLFPVYDTGYYSNLRYVVLQSTLRMDSVIKTCNNELSHSCASQTSSPVDDGNPAGMQVCTENNCLDEARIPDGGLMMRSRRRGTKTKLETFPVLGSKRRGTLWL
jgi:hypothetical protein